MGSGFKNDTMLARNVNFTNVAPGSPTMTLDGQLIISHTALNAGGTHIDIGNITSPLGTISIGYNSPNITIDTVAGGTAVEHLTGNTGGQLNPDGSNNFNTLGTGSITIAGVGSTLTTQLTGLTNHSVLVGAGTSTITKLSVGTNGQVLVGSTTADPVFATLTSSDSSITFTTGAGTLSLQVAGGSTSIKTITGNTGGAESPSAGNFNVLGTGSITVAGSANTETVQLTGLTNHAIQIGAGTATLTQLSIGSTGQVLQANSAADPTWSTATYPSTTTVSQILYSSSANVLSGLSTANSATVVTTSTGVPVLSGTMTNGQMIIGSTGATPAAGTITSTSGTITVSVGAGTLNLEVAGGGFTWTDVTGATQAMSIENGYITDRGAGVVYTLPATAVLGDRIIVVGKLGITTITPNANQQLLIGSASGAVGVTGTAVATNVGDCIELVVITAGASTIWRASNFVGNWTLN